MNREFIDNRGVMVFNDNVDYQQMYLCKNIKNSIRGIHFSPYKKKFQLLSGKMIGYIVDPETLSYTKYYLEKENEIIEIEKNFGHCVLILEENTQYICYLYGKFDPVYERCVNPYCPIINLDIPSRSSVIISDKDNNAPIGKKVDYVLIGSKGFLGLKYILFTVKNFSISVFVVAYNYLYYYII